MAASSDSRWHECGHGTAFKTRWMNDALYQIASFMVLREPTVWRWSHTRHHTDTIIVGRDPEIVAPRPPDFLALALDVLNLKSGPQELIERVPPRLRPPVVRRRRPSSRRWSGRRSSATARIWLAIYAAVIAPPWRRRAGCR